MPKLHPVIALIPSHHPHQQHHSSQSLSRIIPSHHHLRLNIIPLFFPSHANTHTITITVLPPRMPLIINGMTIPSIRCHQELTPHLRLRAQHMSRTGWLSPFLPWIRGGSQDMVELSLWTCYPLTTSASYPTLLRYNASPNLPQPPSTTPHQPVSEQTQAAIANVEANLAREGARNNNVVCFHPCKYIPLSHLLVSRP
jgi:hypothetical protein